MTDTEMDDAYRRDYADKDRIRELREVLEAFLSDPPSRAYPGTLNGLRDLVRVLKAQEAHIVAVWD